MYYFFSTFLDFHEFSFLPKTWEPWCKVIWFSNWNSLEKLEVVVFEFTSKRDKSSYQTESENQMNLIILFMRKICKLQNVFKQFPNLSFESMYYMAKSNYRRRAIITRGLYIFHPVFHCGLYCRAVSFTDNLFTIEGNSSIFVSRIRGL